MTTPLILNQNNCERLISAMTYSALAGHAREKAEAFRSMFVEPADQSLEAQMQAANRFWRVELGLLENEQAQAAIQNARHSLSDALAFEDWLRLFSRDVVGVIAAYWRA